MSDACCTTGSPSAGEYRGNGSIKQVEDFQVYEVGDGAKTVIVLYDIFGFEIGNTRNFCDRLAEAGIRVVMPDYFRGKPFPQENFPPANRQLLMDFIMSRGNAQIVKDTTEVVLKHYGLERFALLGFCWGGKFGFYLAADHRCAAGVSVHGSGFDTKDAEALHAPFFFVSAGDDPDLKPVKEVLDKNPIGQHCAYKLYPDMRHGWCAARGDWSKPDIREAALEVIELSKNFILKHL